MNSTAFPMGISVYLARHNLFIDLDRLICKKRGVTCSHLIDKNSKCPPVHSFVVALEGKEKLINPQMAGWRHNCTIVLVVCYTAQNLRHT